MPWARYRAYRLKAMVSMHGLQSPGQCVYLCPTKKASKLQEFGRIRIMHVVRKATLTSSTSACDGRLGGGRPAHTGCARGGRSFSHSSLATVHEVDKIVQMTPTVDKSTSVERRARRGSSSGCRLATSQWAYHLCRQVAYKLRVKWAHERTSPAILQSLFDSRGSTRWFTRPCKAVVLVRPLPTHPHALF